MAEDKPITLKLFVDKSNNRVAFLESDNDFVDVLLSFLTQPIGTVVKLAADEQSSLGCMDKLYESVKRIEERFLMTEACREMLLSPRKYSLTQRNSLRVDIDDSGKVYYACSSKICRFYSHNLLSFYPSSKCLCGRDMTTRLSYSQDQVNYKDIEGVFVKGTRFVVRDDLVISPVKDTFSLLHKLCISECGNLEEKTATVGHTEVLHLLKRSLISRTPLTDVFLENEAAEAFSEMFPLHVKSTQIQNSNCPQASDESSAKIHIKIVLVKDKKVLYAEAKQDFVDVLFSFLTFPLGFFKKHSNGQSSVGCLDNLYKSVEYLSSRDCVIEECKEGLLNPKLPQSFSCKSQVVGIHEEAPQYYACGCHGDLSTERNAICSSGNRMTVKMNLVDPKSSNAAASSDGSFCKPIMYIVTDELRVAPLSFTAVLSLRKGIDEPIEDRELSLGENEALALLKASLSSKTALTDAFLFSIKHGREVGTGIHWMKHLARQTK